MARIRSIKPSFFASEDVAALPLRARLTWIGLWTHCDDQGRCKDTTRLIKAAVWPLDDDVTLVDVEEDLEVLAKAGRIHRYEANGGAYLAIVNWHEHQKINRPTESAIPPPDAHGGLTEPSPLEGRGKEGKGGERAQAREAPPPRYCPDHPEGTRDPCASCARAREALKAWRSNRTAPTARPHQFTDDGTGTCRSCSLPAANRAHRGAAA